MRIRFAASFNEATGLEPLVVGGIASELVADFVEADDTLRAARRAWTWASLAESCCWRRDNC